jgi:hypothetical protein
LKVLIQAKKSEYIILSIATLHKVVISIYFGNQTKTMNFFAYTKIYMQRFCVYKFEFFLNNNLFFKIDLK